jgi:predicted acylesterase/phospholipase RssA
MRFDLVFEGGGARGIVFVGALQELERRGHSAGRLLGTSAGAVVAMLLAAGYSADELHRSLLEKVDGKQVFAQFLGEPPPFSKEEVQASSARALFREVDMPFVPGFIEDRLDDALVQALLRVPGHRNFYAMLERGGWYAADRFVGWMRARLNSGRFRGRPRRFGDATLSQLHAATGVDVSLVVADTTAGRLRVLNHRTAPGCPAVQAVRMSMNLPFVWPDVIWEESWGAYQGRSLAGNIFVDGGLLSAFPIELFVSNEPYVLSLVGPRSGDGLLGLLIDETLPLPVEPSSTLLPSEISLTGIRAVQRISRMVSTMTGARDRMVVDAFAEHVVRLPAQGYGTIEFNMDDLKRDRLIAAGRVAMAAWFDRPQPSDAASPENRAWRDNYATRAARDLLAP